MSDGDLRALCNRFLDSVERNDIEELASVYAPGFTIWVNVTGTEQSSEENIATLIAGKAVHRRRTYDDRQIRTFAGGFLVQYSVNVLQHDGRKRSLWACLIAQCKGGQITHIDEYLDSSKFTGRPKAGATA